MELIAVAAVAENGVIGAGGEIPWPSIPADREQYRARIADDPVILGRQTFDEMRDELPGASQIVLSRSRTAFDAESARHAENVETAFDILEDLEAKEAYVIGGATIYELFLPYTDRMFISRVAGWYEGDSYFPDWDRAAWELVAQTPYERFTLEEWQRTDGAARPQD